MPATRIYAVLGAVLTLPLLSACRDDRAHESHSKDDGTADHDPERSPACQECVMGGGSSACRSAYEACVANVKCNRMAVCEFERGCLATATRNQECLRICSTAAGIRTLRDPAFQLALQLNVTAAGHCGAACGAK
jgi:hypothetical protein